MYRDIYKVYTIYTRFSATVVEHHQQLVMYSIVNDVLEAFEYNVYLSTYYIIKKNASINVHEYRYILKWFIIITEKTET